MGIIIDRAPAALCLLSLLTASWAESETSVSVTTNVLSPSGSSTVRCHSVCDRSGRILECETAVDNACQSVDVMVCLYRGRPECEWDAVAIPCRDREAAMEDACRRATDLASKYKPERVTRRDAVGSGKSAMAASSGNGHAVAYDGETLAESRNGQPPSFYNVPGMSFAFPFAFHPAASHPPKMPYPSPFQSIFASVGLEDPMTMLQGPERAAAMAVASSSGSPLRQPSDRLMVWSTFKET